MGRQENKRCYGGAAVLVALALGVFGCADEEKLAKIGDSCIRDSECESARCDELVCKAAAPKEEGAPCEHPLECRSEHCRFNEDGETVCGLGEREDGQPCTDDLQCRSGECVADTCGGAGNDGGPDSDGAPGGDGGLEDGAGDGPVDGGGDLEGDTGADLAADQSVDALTDAVDLGPQLPIYTDFSEYIIGDPPHDWTKNASQYSFFTALMGPTYAGGVRAEIYCQLNNGTAVWWDKAGVAKDVEVLMSQMAPGLHGTTSNGVGIRMQGDTPGGQGYFTAIDANGDGRIYDTSRQMSTTAVLGLVADTETFTRFRVIGGTMKARFWQGGLAAEPTVWHVETTDPTWTSGHIGLSSARSGITGLGRFNFDRFAVAYNGDTATFP